MFVLVYPLLANALFPLRKGVSRDFFLLPIGVDETVSTKAEDTKELLVDKGNSPGTSVHPRI